METKLQKPYPTGYKVLIVQDLWQAHYVTLLIFLLREFIKLNINIDKITKTVKLGKLNTKL